MKAVVRKFARIKQMDERGRSFIARLSDTSEDRDGDIVHPDGFLPHMDTFMKNPVITAGHMWGEFSIGKVNDFEITADAFDFSGEFAPTERGEEAAVLYRGGFMNAFSAGFLPHEFRPRHDDGGRLLGFEFFEQELLEAAAVTVPSNRNAIQLQYAYEKQGLLALVNMAGIVGQCGKQIQEVAVPADDFTHEEAERWLSDHGFAQPVGKLWKGGCYRFVFFDPQEADGDLHTFEVDAQKGITATVGVRKAGERRAPKSDDVESDSALRKEVDALRQKLDAAQAGIVPVGVDALYLTCQRANEGLAFALQDPAVLAKASEEAITELARLKRVVSGIEVPRSRGEVEAELLSGIHKAAKVAERVLAKFPEGARG